MSKLPKLEITQPARDQNVEVLDLENARDFLEPLLSYGSEVVVTVEGQTLSSYEELVKLANRDCYKDKKFLKVEVWPILGGG